MSTTDTVVQLGPFIGGVAEPPEGPVMEIRDPARPDRVVGTASASSPGVVGRAVGTARDAFAAWAGRGVAERGEIVGHAVQTLRGAVDELASLLTAEQGKPLREARIELNKAAETLEHYAGLAKELRGISVAGLDPGVTGQVLRRPLGVVGAIVPWNFPTTLLANKLGPALVAGNTVVAKPADTTPLTTLRVAALLHEGGLPEGVLNVVPGTGADAGEALVTHPLVAKVAFTGSTPTGRRIMALASGGTKRLTLELGGSDPLIILADADLERAASAASMGRFFNCGQACLAVKRLYVAESVADEVVEAVTGKAGRLSVGPGTAEGTQIGPLHSDAQRDRLEDQLRRTLERGGEVLAGGGRPQGEAVEQGWFHEPTVVLEPPQDSPMATEEVFGPVLPIWRVRDLDDAIERANASPFGLGSSVWTSDLDAAAEAAERLECGYTWINSPTKVYDELPFGGVKASGFGKEHGSEAFDFYTDQKSVVVRRGGDR
ncbi:MAG TPA: aldehyde dehydrogenase family protein [Solirubrobacteraceae bacterium]|jgi:succinate-semialdehyde dehydrogenase/glutarate-semialdehyde dehydrogenase|nr:aldehyde dehydrogenase family protein [Solirubrobacteraceae bacterium]